MKLMLSCALLVSTTSAAFAQTPITGTWQGYWARNGDTMLVTLNVRDSIPNRYTATFDPKVAGHRGLLGWLPNR